MTQPSPSSPVPGDARVSVSNHRLRVSGPAGDRDLPLIALPDPMARWIEAGRSELYDRLARDPGQVRFFSQHLPVLVTFREGDPFPANCGNKGVGFLPRPGDLARWTDAYRQVLERTRGRPWKESFAERVGAARSFQEDRDALDRRCLGTLEIFEGETYRNLRRHPLASLLFTGHCPAYMSFQVDCAVEVVGEGDPRFEFLRLSRSLFEFDRFHIPQPPARHGYLFWVSGVRDKTPHSLRLQGAEPAADAPPWDDAALAALAARAGDAAPALRPRVSEYARERGYARVTTQALDDAFEALRPLPRG